MYERQIKPHKLIVIQRRSWIRRTVCKQARSSDWVKLSQLIRAQGGHLVFPIEPKNTNLVEDVEILLPINFRWIMFCGFRGEVEYVKVYDGRTDGRRTSCVFSCVLTNTVVYTWTVHRYFVWQNKVITISKCTRHCSACLHDHYCL